jgi:hypothetical protein
MGQEPKIVDFSGLCEVLNVKENTLRHYWRKLPHFFVGRSKSRPMARFDINDVLLFLKAEGENYGPVLVSGRGGEKESVMSVYVKGEALSKERLSYKERSVQMRTGEKERKTQAGTIDDPFDLLPSSLKGVR